MINNDSSKEILLLVDYRGYFYSSIKRFSRGMDLDLLEKYFSQAGYRLTVIKYSEIDFRKEEYRDRIVLYQSSEDNGTHYKGYLEDILYGLLLKGAILIPSFKYFRAHNNKSFMEILRDLSNNQRLKNIRSIRYGTLEDFKVASDHHFPIVIKQSEGFGSKGVAKAHSMAEAYKVAKKFSLLRVGIKERVKSYIRPYLKKYFKRDFVFSSRHRQKIIIQNFIKNLSNDYKIIIFWNKYYILARNNRPNDFRASGSGLFHWISNPPEGILDFAETVFKEFDVPYISLDVGFDEKEFFLMEFQFLMFGTLTMERSSFYFTDRGGAWILIKEKPVLEREISESIINYLRAHDAE